MKAMILRFQPNLGVLQSMSRCKSEKSPEVDLDIQLDT